MMLIGGVLISIENRTQTSDIKYLTTLLTAKTVKKIEITLEPKMYSPTVTKEIRWRH